MGMAYQPLPERHFKTVHLVCGRTDYDLSFEFFRRFKQQLQYFQPVFTLTNQNPQGLHRIFLLNCRNYLLQHDLLQQFPFISSIITTLEGVGSQSSLTRIKSNQQNRLNLLYSQHLFHLGCNEIKIPALIEKVHYRVFASFPTFRWNIYQ